MIAALIALSISLNEILDKRKSQYTLAVVNIGVAVGIRARDGKMLKVEVDKSKEAKLSKDELSSIGEINFLTARCRIMEGRNLRDCRITSASIETESASRSYRKILEAIKVVGCQYQRCPDAEGSIFVKFFAPGAAGVTTNFCVAPFCVARPSPPVPPPYTIPIS